MKQRALFTCANCSEKFGSMYAKKTHEKSCKGKEIEVEANLLQNQDSELEQLGYDMSQQRDNQSIRKIITDIVN